MALSPDDLLLPFRGGITPRGDFRVGIELEYFPVRRADLRMVPYGAQPGIQTVLETMAASGRWEPINEGDLIVGLSRADGHVTLEPGGVIEYSTAPAETIDATRALVEAFLGEIASVMAPLDLALLPVGFHPIDAPDDVELVPKDRYRFMYDYMPRVGGRGRWMMKVTCAIQVAIDFDSERDAMRKLRLAAGLTPLLVALSANSMAREGRVSDRASNRAHAWLDTDPARCGFQPFVFDENAGFRDYVEWALDAPVYFVTRDGRQIPLGEHAFRELLAGRVRDRDGGTIEPTAADWDLHLGTLFPWVRMRHFIEIRSFDMTPWSLALALAALVKGVFHDRDALVRAETLAAPDRRAADNLLDAAIARGLDGETAGRSLRSDARELLRAARRGLERCDPTGAAALSPLDDRVETWSFAAERDTLGAGLDRRLREMLVE